MSDSSNQHRNDDLARLSARMQRIEDRLGDKDEIADLKLSSVHDKIDKLREDMQEIEERFDLYVTVARYSPVEKLVYGMVGLVLALAVTALMSTVINSSPPGG